MTKIDELTFPCYLEYERARDGMRGIKLLKSKSDLEKYIEQDDYFPLLGRGQK